MGSRKNRELITGLFRPTLERKLAERIGAIQADGPGASVIVLVGSNMLALHLRRLLAKDTPLWNVRFFTFAEMARTLGSAPLRALGRRPTPDLAEQFIVRDVVGKLPKGYFDPVAGMPGFITTAAESIRDLKEAGLPPAALGRTRGPKLAAFKDVFAGYEKALAKLGLYDQADLTAAAAEAAPGSELVAGSELIAYGFYDLNGLQRRLLLALASAAKSAAAIVPYADAPAFEYAKPLIDWLAGQGFEQSAGPEPPDELTERLFGERGKALDAPGVRIVSAPGEPREVNEVVRQVLDWADHGVPFHEIGVLLRNADAYSRLLRDAFDRCRIPTFIAGGSPVSETRNARSLEMLAALFAGDLSRTDVMQFVHFAPLAFDDLLGCRPNTADWDLLTIEAGIVEGADAWTRRLGALERRFDRSDDDLRAGLRAELPHLRAFVRELLALKQAVPASGSWSAVVEPLTSAFERLVEPSDERDRVCGEVRKLCQLDQLGSTATFADVCGAITDFLARRAQPSRGFQRGKVTIGRLFELRGLGFRAVIVPGLAEKSFPSACRQDPILFDEERRAIVAKAGAGVYLPPKSARLAEERMLFALALGAGAEHATFTFSRLDVATARERVPSHFLVRLTEAVTGEVCSYATLESVSFFDREPMFPAAGSDRPALDLDDFDLRTVARLTATKEKAKQAFFLKEVSEQFARGVDVETARWQEKTFTQFDGIVQSAAHKTIAGEPMSPTRIEAYAACPFAYFVDRVLGVGAVEEPEEIERITPLDRGSLLHRIFFTAYAACRKKGREVSADGLAAALVEAAEKECSRLGTVGPAMTWAIDKAEMLADLRRFAEIEAPECDAIEARPAMFEVRFGMPSRGGDEDPASTDTPLERSIEGKTYQFKGKIDRIDEVGAGEARVIDYKTGRASGKPDTFAGGTALQLPIYILAAQMLQRERTVTSAQYSFATGRGEFKSVGFSREALDARMAELEHIIATVEGCIEQGVFIATPADPQCGYCDFRDVCGANKAVLFDRKKDDPAVADLLALGEIE